MAVKVKNDIMDLLGMKEKMDVIVFDYIDTSKHWAKAFKGLSSMLHQAIDHYKAYVKKHDGQIPAANSYWLLFADLTAKLAYFNALVMHELQNEKDVTINQQELENLVLLAGFGLPAIDDEENEELLKEIFKLYKKLPIANVKKQALEFEKSVRENNGSVKEALQYFHTKWILNA